jgi:raffinose/stachyose/melibiose transport system permease protein
MRMTRTTPYAFILPAALFYLLFVLWPITNTAWLGLAGADGDAAMGASFAQLLDDARFWTALGNNVLLVVLSLLVQLPIAMALALLLAGRLPGRGLFRTIYFAPMILSTAAIAFLWRFLYDPAELGGPINTLLRSVGLPAVGWLSDPDVDLFAITAVVCWRYIGFHAVILLAGLQGIPGDVYEAARIDGASRWITFRDVTLPMMRPVIAISATLSVIGSLKYFDIFYVMSPGGGQDGSADLVATHMYRTAFPPGGGLGDAGYASALATALLVVTLLVALVAIRFLRGRST